MANDRMAGAAGLLEDYVDGTQTRAVGWFSSTQIAELTKYSGVVAAGDDVVCYMFLNYPLAHDTTDTPLSASVAGLVAKKTSVTAISAAGDYFIDHDLGLLFVYEAGGNAIPSPWTTSATITYYHYLSEVAGAGNGYMCATGDLNYGDLLTYDEDSNLIKASLDIAAAEGFDGSGNVYSADPDYSAAADADIPPL